MIILETDGDGRHVFNRTSSDSEEPRCFMKSARGFKPMQPDQPPGHEDMVADNKAQRIDPVSICSADGWTSLTFEFRDKLIIQEGAMVVCTIRGDGKFWDRQQSLTSEAVGELVPDYDLYLSQVILLEER